MADLDAKTQEQLDELVKLVNDGKITMTEYNARRRALLKGEAAPAAAAPPPAAAAPPPPADTRHQPQEPEHKPTGWTDRSGTKTWSAGARTDNPELRQVHAPLEKGIGDGKAVLFLFGFRKGAKMDQEMMGRELEAIQDDIEVLRKAGYTVVVDPQATKQEFLDAVAGQGDGAKDLAPSMLYWSGHGHPDGAVDCCDGNIVKPSDVDPAKVSPNLKICVLAACYVGAHSQTWKKQLGGHPLVVGWGRPVTIDRAVEFLRPNEETETDLDDLIRRFLLIDAPLPGEPTNAFSPLEPKEGRKADLPERIKSVASMLGARWREHEKTVEVDVPLPEGRSHYIHVFIVDSAQPYSEGEPLLAVEGDVGEITKLVDPPMLLAGLSDPGYSRVSLVKSKEEMPRIVAQGFLPISRVRDTDLAALVYQVARTADELERRIFGGDMR
jgi:hypothetical protein